MTTSLFVSGTPVGRHARQDAGDLITLTHAVAKPVVDGLESSVCGLLVTAAAADDWPTVRNTPRCEECSRIAG